MAIIPPDWTLILNKKGNFSEQEIACAAQWPTCAIGEGAHRFPEAVSVYLRVDPGCPRDPHLISLGMQFSLAVDRHKRIEARRIYRLIQERIAVLKGH